MELLCALLMGIFLWLCFISGIKSLRIGVREDAGLLLETVNCSNKINTLRNRLLICSCYVCYPFFLGLIIARNNGTSVDWYAFFQIVLWTWLLFGLAPVIIQGHKQRFLQIRENGIVFTHENDHYQRYHFIPWRDINFCKWVPSEEILLIQKQNGALDFHIAANHCKNTIETLGRFVDVRDQNDNIIPAPLDRPLANAPNNTLKPKLSLKRPLFQFDLRTLLLLMMVFASGFSWYGIRYRHRGQIRNEIAKHEKKYGDVHYGFDGIDVMYLNFTFAQNKPGDDDLIEIQKFPRLQWLYLTNSPISDAGLIHIESLSQLNQLDLTGTKITDSGLEILKRLNNLNFLSISATKITPKGAENLQRAMPHTGIIYATSSSTSSKSLSIPPPPTAK
jgi:Leucine-rich repeat (LRR) protein